MLKTVLARFRLVANKKYLYKFISVLVLLLVFSFSFSRVVKSQDIGKKAQTPHNSSIAASIVGFGVLGDSDSDEYQGTDNRPAYNWIEQLVTTRYINAGSWGTRSEPRRTGYAYNWARSGAKAQSMISQGQHTGLANQISQGLVTHAVIWIGGNDFHFRDGTYQDICKGRLTGSELENKISRVVSNISTAINTLTNAGTIDLVVAGIADKALTSDMMAACTESERIISSGVMRNVNDRIKAAAQAKGAAYLDITDIGLSLIDVVDPTTGALSLCGVKIYLLNKCNLPTCGILNDNHVGTVGNGFIVNAFIDTFNAAYQTGIVPLSDAEILTIAGLDVSGCSGSSPTPTSLPTNTPEPSVTISGTHGDADGDEDVDIDDYQIFIAQYLNYNPSPSADPDFNNDLRVDGIDYVIWIDNYSGS